MFFVHYHSRDYSLSIKQREYVPLFYLQHTSLNIQSRIGHNRPQAPNPRVVFKQWESFPSWLNKGSTCLDTQFFATSAKTMNHFGNEPDRFLKYHTVVPILKFSVEGLRFKIEAEFSRVVG